MKNKINTNVKVTFFDGSFEIKDLRTGNSYSYISKLSLDASYNPEKFEIFFLYNSNRGISENSIFKVFADGIRIGWIFPIQSLESCEHDYVQDEYYLKYAYVALYKLIQMIELDSEEYSDINILKHFSDETQILLYDKDNIKEIENFNIYNYSVSLFLKGYSYNGKGNVFTDIEIPDKNIRLKQLPDSIKNISYINILFRDLIPLQETSYSRFHLLYQIIEILIGIVFNSKMKELILEMAKSSYDLFDKRQKLNDITIEKNRVIWLFNEFVNIDFQKLQILDDFCMELLKNNNKKYDEKNVASNLYAVRCLIVHNLYSLNKESRNLLQELNDSFLDVILDILVTFKENV